MALVDIVYKEPGTVLEVDVRGRKVSAEVVALPFYKRKENSAERAEAELVIGGKNMNFPEELKYTKSHEWVKLEDETTAYVGVSEMCIRDRYCGSGNQ